jgi:hypothetical protein
VRGVSTARQPTMYTNRSWKCSTEPTTPLKSCIPSTHERSDHSPKPLTPPPPPASSPPPLVALNMLLMLVLVRVGVDGVLAVVGGHGIPGPPPPPRAPPPLLPAAGRLLGLVVRVLLLLARQLLRYPKVSFCVPQ